MASFALADGEAGVLRIALTGEGVERIERVRVQLSNEGGAAVLRTAGGDDRLELAPRADTVGRAGGRVFEARGLVPIVRVNPVDRTRAFLRSFNVFAGTSWRSRTLDSLVEFHVYTVDAATVAGLAVTEPTVGVRATDHVIGLDMGEEWGRDQETWWFESGPFIDAVAARV